MSAISAAHSPSLRVVRSTQPQYFSRDFSGAGVLEIIENHDGKTYRAVYTVKFSGVVYVLHVFQKKSKRGIATPKKELDLVRMRLRSAREHFEEHRGQG